VSCKSTIFDPLEWAYVYVLAKKTLPELSFHRDWDAAELAGKYAHISYEVLKDLDWCCPVIYMPPFEQVVNGSVVVAVEGYTAKKLYRRGVRADVVVTDWDFEPEGTALGRIAVVHAHGDNYWRIPKGDYVYSVQTWPTGCTVNFSGFTDGDRAVYMAYYLGARELTISGFYPHIPLKRSDEIKRKKLAVAKHLINRVAARIPVNLI